MSPSADRDDGPPPGRGLAELLLFLLLLSAAPLVASRLPNGPASLATERSIAVGSAFLLLVFLLVVWPCLKMRDRPGALAVTGTLYLLAGATFVFVHALAGGTGLAEPLGAAGVLVATTVVTGFYLVGTSERRPDRWFALLVLIVTAALPLANYAMNELGGTTWQLGYRLSPPLLIRRILLGLSDTDPLPFYLLSLVILALLVARSLLMRGVPAVIALVMFTGSLSAEELSISPLLGDSYVPGRALPVLVKGGEGDGSHEVQIPGVALVRGTSGPDGAVLLLPAARGIGLVHIADGDSWVERDLDVTELPHGARLLVSFSAVTDEFLDQAEMRLVVVSRALPAVANLPAGTLLKVLASADGVLDPARVLSEDAVRALKAGGVYVMRAADAEELDRLVRIRSVLRRIWEEEETILLPDGLFDVFPAENATNPERSRAALAILGGFALLVLVGVRFTLRRGIHLITPILVAALAAGWTVFLGMKVLPPWPDWDSRSITLREDGRAVRIELLKARKAALGVGRGTMVLGRGALPAIGAPVAEVPLAAHEMRIVVGEEIIPAAPVGEADLYFGPQGLRLPGEDPEPPVKFLKNRLPGAPGRPDYRGVLLRKLIRLSEPPDWEVGIRFPVPGRPFLDVYQRFE